MDISWLNLIIFKVFLDVVRINLVILEIMYVLFYGQIWSCFIIKFDACWMFYDSEVMKTSECFMDIFERVGNKYFIVGFSYIEDKGYIIRFGYIKDKWYFIIIQLCRKMFYDWIQPCQIGPCQREKEKGCFINYVSWDVTSALIDYMRDPLSLRTSACVPI